jgi:RsiW-degrading membrane proteinase PrsW (M82 family)
MPMNHSPIIEATKQSWKLLLLAIALFLSFCIMAFGIYSTISHIAISADNAVITTIIGVVAGLITSIIACLSVRCPECRTSWIWHAVSKENSNQWVPWLLSVSKCPKCNFQPKAASNPKMKADD